MLPDVVQASDLQSTIRQYIELRRMLAQHPQEDQTVNAISSAAASDPVGLLATTSVTAEARKDNVGDDCVPAGDGSLRQPAPGKTRTLLEKIGFLTAESVRTSEEKHALATTVYDLVSFRWWFGLLESISDWRNLYEG